MFSQLFSAAEPPPDEGKTSGVGKYVASASSAVGKGAKTAGPILAKGGSALLAALKKAGQLAMKGLRGSMGAVKSKFGDKGETTTPVVSAADEGPKDES